MSQNTAILDYAQYLASLPNTEARRGAQAAVNKLVLASLPEDEVTKPPVRPLGQYLDEDIELPPILVEPGLVARGAISVLVSRGGKGKTAVSLNRLLRWSMGKPLFDELPELMKPIKPLRILLIENEGSPGHFQMVLKTILHSNGFASEDIEAARENVHLWGNGGWSGLKLDDEGNRTLVRRAVEQVEPDILFLEPFRGLWRGNENDATEMSNVLDALSDIANAYNLGVLVTHHERKAGADGGDPMTALRGSSVFEGHAAVMERWAPAAGADQRELSWIKTRFEEAPAPVRMEFERDRWGYRLVEDNERLMAVVQALRNLAREDFITIGDLAEEVGETYHVARRWANKAVEDGWAKRRAYEGKVAYRYVPQAADDDDDDTLTVT